MDGDDPIIQRVERELGHPGLIDALAALSPTDVTSFLLALARRRADDVTAAGLVRAHASNRFVEPSSLDPRALRAAEGRLLELLPEGFDLVDLAPVTPLGAAHVLGMTPQDWVISAGRDTEVVSDPTVALALECAARRREQGRVNLVAIHRTLRGQKFPAPYRQHFVLAACCSAGRDEGSHAFDAETLHAHLGLYLQLALDRQAPDLRVVTTPLRGGLDEERLRAQVIDPLAGRFPSVRFEVDGARQDGEPGYYLRTCFKLWSGEGERAIDLGDGGFTDWAARLLGDRKERLLTSAVSLERLADSAP